MNKDGDDDNKKLISPILAYFLHIFFLLFVFDFILAVSIVLLLRLFPHPRNSNKILGTNVSPLVAAAVIVLGFPLLPVLLQPILQPLIFIPC
jgi:hypothetical protein